MVEFTLAGVEKGDESLNRGNGNGSEVSGGLISH